MDRQTRYDLKVDEFGVKAYSKNVLNISVWEIQVKAIYIKYLMCVSVHPG